MTKHPGFLISAHYYSDQRPIQFFLFESEAVEFLRQLNDAQELTIDQPEYFDILKDMDPEITVMSFEKVEYKIEEIVYE